MCRSEFQELRFRIKSLTSRQAGTPKKALLLGGSSVLRKNSLKSQKHPTNVKDLLSFFANYGAIWRN